MKTFQNGAYLKRHEEKQACSSDVYKCDVCPKVLKNFQAFQAHKTHCAKQFTEHKCLMCTKVFLDASQLKRHIRNQVCTKPMKKCEVCEAFFPPGVKFYNHKKTHIKKDITYHSCSECGKVFHSSTDMKLHSYVHSGEKPFPCKICNKAFRTPGNLKTHEASHSSERNFACNLCDKTFKLKQTLKKHEQTHFNVSKPHTCGFCGLSFRENGNLKRHLQTHVKNELIHCPDCDKTFTNEMNLKTHFDRLHNDVKPFECDRCNQAFAAKHLLTRHKKKIHV